MSRTISATLAACVFLLVLSICLPSTHSVAVAQSAGASGYHLVKKVKLGGTGGWDYLEVDPATRQCTALAKRVMIVFEAPLLIVCFAVFAYLWDWRIALIHAILVAAMAFLLIETLLLSFRKIPFTCSAPPFKQTTIVSVILYIVGLFAFSAVVPPLERQAFRDPFSSAVVIVILLMLWWLCLYAARKNQIEPDRRLIFEDTLPPAVEVLDLTFRR